MKRLPAVLAELMRSFMAIKRHIRTMRLPNSPPISRVRTMQ